MYIYHIWVLFTFFYSAEYQLKHFRLKLELIVFIYDFHSYDNIPCTDIYVCTWTLYLQLWKTLNLLISEIQRERNTNIRNTLTSNVKCSETSLCLHVCLIDLTLIKDHIVWAYLGMQSDWVALYTVTPREKTLHDPFSALLSQCRCHIDWLFCESGNGTRILKKGKRGKKSMCCALILQTGERVFHGTLLGLWSANPQEDWVRMSRIRW